TIVENIYGNEAMAYDRQANDFPSLLHVFSAGNAGTETPAHGTYAGINGFANLTGNFKQAKNVMTVGSVDSSGQLMQLSSRGPAYDGRIKPELVAYGEDGSSGAAATVSGVALLMQNAYQNLYNSMPPASLVKAIMINSADDAGPAHPDYLSGFGNLNAYRSLNTIMQNRFALHNLQQDDTVHIPINIGNDIARIKISLCWNDPGVDAGAAKALVHQLDLRLLNEDGSQTWLPWVLDPTPAVAALQSPATRKKDTLNNIEQITLEFPATGVYDIQVIGVNISGSQDFALTWQLDTMDHFYWTYPAHSDQLISGNTHWLRWTTNRHIPAQIEYATETDNWRLAGQVTDASLGYFKLRLPDTIASARLRMRFIDSTINSEAFTISPQLNLQVGYNCTDSFLLYWNKVHNGSYLLYQLGARYLEPFMQVSDTFIILNKQDHPSIYYTIAPRVQGVPGIKANTVNYPSLGPACYINAFYLQSQVDGTAFFNVDLGTIFGISEMAIEKQTAQGFQVVQIHAQPPGQSFILTVPGLTPGENLYRLRIKTIGGAYVYSNVEIVYFWLTEPVLVYPNPVRRGETIKLLASESGRFTIQLVNALGSLLHRQSLYSTRTEIPTHAYAPGIYWIRIFDRDGKSLQKKILIQ
ncbi:MAG: S8 family peptidase, partial [Flavisolibacter sp.]